MLSVAESSPVANDGSRHIREPRLPGCSNPPGGALNEGEVGTGGASPMPVTPRLSRAVTGGRWGHRVRPRVRSERLPGLAPGFRSSVNSDLINRLTRVGRKLACTEGGQRMTDPSIRPRFNSGSERFLEALRVAATLHAGQTRKKTDIPTSATCWVRARSRWSSARTRTRRSRRCSTTPSRTSGRSRRRARPSARSVRRCSASSRPAPTPTRTPSRRGASARSAISLTCPRPTRRSSSCRRPTSSTTRERS